LPGYQQPVTCFLAVDVFGEHVSRGDDETCHGYCGSYAASSSCL
jgi:hypothetical protein